MVLVFCTISQTFAGGCWETARGWWCVKVCRADGLCDCEELYSMALSGTSSKKKDKIGGKRKETQ